jgi:hypothetical protein
LNFKERRYSTGKPKHLRRSKSKGGGNGPKALKKKKKGGGK